MKIKLAVLSGVLLFMAACSHYDELQNNAKESRTGDDESHNAGENCMRCHNAGEFSEAALEGWWNIGGTAYKNGRTAKSGYVELWTGPNRTGEFLYRLEIDELGNFYTSKIIDFQGGFLPVLLNADGSFNAGMSSKTVVGACNTCHDNKTQDRITFY